MGQNAGGVRRGLVFSSLVTVYPVRGGAVLYEH
jgi:hypothetical protein